MADKNMEDSDIEPAPKLIQVVFQNCRGQVDQWVEPYLRISVERLRRAEKSYLKCLLIQVVSSQMSTFIFLDIETFCFIFKCDKFLVVLLSHNLSIVLPSLGSRCYILKLDPFS